MDRRTFLKHSFFGAAALGLGFKLGLNGAPAIAGQRCVLHAFLPDESQDLTQAVQAFLASLPAGSLPSPNVSVAPRWRDAIQQGLAESSERFVRSGDWQLAFHLEPLATSMPADLVSQLDGSLQTPMAFSSELAALRRQLQGRKASLALTARLEPAPEVGRGRVLLVENERGLQERIALKGRSHTLELKGAMGTTRVRVDAEGVRVAEAGCRHQTCKCQGIIRHPGELIACAPNRLLLRIESA